MPTSPLLSTARPTPAHAQSIQRLPAGPGPACWASNTAHSTRVSAAVNPASSVKKWLLTTIQVVEPAIISACAPATGPHSRRAQNPSRKTVARPASPGHRRAANSFTPSSCMLRAPAQY